MTVIVDLAAWREFRNDLGDRSVGFVPTMGALHEGHCSLIRRSAADNDVTVVSVFVNATQFNQAADLESYPRQLEEDAQRAVQAGADRVLAPEHDAIYADGYGYRVTESSLSRHMEGSHRPGHFDGVLTVVLKLFGLVRPDRAYFGEKDYQQLLLIRGMVEAFFLPVEIVPCATVRDADGLALSSRNARLSPEARARAARFPELMAAGGDSRWVGEQLTSSGFEVDYVVDSDGRRFGAVVIDGVRLIDNISLVPDKD